MTEVEQSPITRSNAVWFSPECKDGHRGAILELTDWLDDKIDTLGWNVVSWNIVFVVRGARIVANGTCTYYEGRE